MTAPGTRLVVLGASNVARGLPDLLSATRDLLDGPVELLAALGHGRSYGLESSFLGRRLPGIRQCDLWQALDRVESMPTVAVVSDVGNDLLYGVAPTELANWVEECVERLQGKAGPVLLMRPPLDRLASLSRVGFEVARRLFFPARPYSFEDALEDIADLDRRLCEVAQRLHVRELVPPRSWYGIDPIHITRRERPDAWREMLRAVLEGESAAHPHASPVETREWLRLRTSRQARVRLLGRDLGVEQPVCRLRDGSTVSLY